MHWLFDLSRNHSSHLYGRTNRIKYEILEIMLPLRKYTRRLNAGCWMNAYIFRAIKYRRFYVNLFRQTRVNEHLRLSYVWRNRVNTMIDNAMAKYIKSQLDRNVKHPKKIWRIINNFLDNSPTSLCDVTFTNDDGMLVQKEDEANFLNNYFVDILTRLGLNSERFAFSKCY